MIRREVIVILLLLFLSLPTIQDLLFPGPFTSHDLTHHIVRQIDMNRLLSEGQFPPRWSGELNNGYGYPLFLFNYPLPALVGQLFHLLGLGYIDSVKAILGLSLLGSSVTMYLFLRSLLGNRTAAFLGAIFYLYAPVRFLNVYVSAALGNALALLFVPLVFLSVNKLAKTGKKLWIMGGAKLDKIALLERALQKYDYILIGGALAFAFLKAKGIPIGASKTDAASKVGEMLAEKAKESGIKEAVFDRGGFKYHGRIKALAEGLRKGGLKV